MNLIVNQRPFEMELEKTNISTFVASRGMVENSVAVAVNGEVVPRSQWSAVMLTEGDQVDIVKVVAGGDETDDEPLVIGGRRFTSRLFLGTGKYPSAQAMVSSLESSGTEMVTVAIRYMDLDGSGNGLDILPHLDRKRYQLLPNTAGATTAKQAVTMAQLAREATGTNWIKLEVIGDSATLWPDVAGTVEATKTLVNDGFVVLAYTSPDIVAALRLEDAGAAAVMPLASMIGSGRGFQDRSSVSWIVDRVKVPVVVDAGLGVPSEAAHAMELGARACLVNTAVAKAHNPARMAAAFRLAVESGRQAYLAGRMEMQPLAAASSPLTGVPVVIE